MNLNEFDDNYLSKLDILILIGLKRLGLHYPIRAKIYNHYKKTNKFYDRFKKEVQRFIFRPPFQFFAMIRPQRMPFQEGMNNLVEHFRQLIQFDDNGILNREAFDHKFKNYLKQLAFKNSVVNYENLCERIDNYNHSSYAEPLYASNMELGSRIYTLDQYLLIESASKSLKYKIPLISDLVTNIDIYDPLSLIESVSLSIGDERFIQIDFRKIPFRIGFYFTQDLVFSPLIPTDYKLTIIFKAPMLIAPPISINIMIHDLPVEIRKLLFQKNYYLETSRFNHSEKVDEYFYNHGHDYGIVSKISKRDKFNWLF